MSLEEVVTRAIQKARILGQSLGDYKCGKKGHMKRDCPDCKKKKDNKNESSSKSTSIVKDNSDDADGDRLSVASNSE